MIQRNGSVYEKMHWVSAAAAHTIPLFPAVTFWALKGGY
jgi:hypothetical protein